MGCVSGAREACHVYSAAASRQRWIGCARRASKQAGAARRRRPHPLSTLGISQQARSTIYLLAGRAHASSDIAGGRPRGSDGAAISGVHSMSDYSRRGREASGPPLVISKYSQASARTSSIALLCPPAPPALGREFRFQKAMMALARAEIPPISGFQFISGGFHAYSSVSQSVFPGPNVLVLQRPKKYSVFPVQYAPRDAL